MKYIILVIVLGVGGYFGWNYYQDNFNKGIKVTIINQTVSDADPMNSDVNLNQNYKAHVLYVNVQNNSDEPFVLMPSEQFRLRSGPNLYELSPDNAIEDPLFGGEIGPGQSVKGEISFHAPTNNLIELQFRTDTESEDWQKI